MRLGHLALAVTDQERSASFYERFGLRRLRREADGTLMLGDEDGAGFLLALGLVEQPPRQPPFARFGFPAASPGEVARLRSVLAGEGVRELDWVDEPAYTSVKVADPDGYRVEVYWEQPPGA